MKKFLMIFAAGVFATSTAIASEKESSFPKVDLSVVTMSALPKYNFDTSEIANIEFGVSYNAKLTDELSVVPYAEVNYNNDFDRGDSVLGLKTKYTF